MQVTDPSLGERWFQSIEGKGQGYMTTTLCQKDKKDDDNGDDDDINLDIDKSHRY